MIAGGGSGRRARPAIIFIVTYALIATERIDKTIAALLGGTAVVVVGIVDQEEAFGAIDLNVIFLLAGMMTMATILRRTGLLPVARDPLGQARRRPSRTDC